MKNIPNIITLSRIILSFSLLLIQPFTVLFLLVYSICGVTDMIDGYIARKTHTTSDLGSKLDSLADLIFMVTVMIVLFPFLTISKIILIWIFLIAGIRFISLLIAYYKFHTFAFLHTYANKITGFFLFCIPYLFEIYEITIIATIACTIASISAIEELTINIFSKELSRNITGIIEKVIKVDIKR
jgi:hypothetical protein